MNKKSIVSFVGRTVRLVGVSLFIFILLMVLFVFFTVVDEYKNRWRARNISGTFQVFDAHLKDVCAERENKNECPVDLSEVIAYNPSLYKKLSRSAYWLSKPRYIFNEKTGEYIFAVQFDRRYSVVSSEKYYPGYAFVPNEELEVMIEALKE